MYFFHCQVTVLILRYFSCRIKKCECLNFFSKLLILSYFLLDVCFANSYTFSLSGINVRCLHSFHTSFRAGYLRLFHCFHASACCYPYYWARLFGICGLQGRLSYFLQSVPSALKQERAPLQGF